MSNTHNDDTAAVRGFMKTVFLGIAVCEIISLLIFLVIGKFSLAVLLGAVWGGFVMTVYYLLMAVGVSKAARETDPDVAKKRIQASYSQRLLLLALLMGAGVFVAAEYGWIHWLPMILSMIYPRISIAVWQVLNSKKMADADTPADQLEPIPYTEEDDEEEGDL